MTLEEAIKHAEEVAVEQDKLCKRYDDASGYSRSHNEAIRVNDAKKCEECAKEHRQLAEWLKDYQRLLSAIDDIKAEIKALKRAYPINYVSADDAVDTCLAIIDRHIGKESE